MTELSPLHYALPADPRDRYCESHRRALSALHGKGYLAGFNGKSPLGSIVVVTRPFLNASQSTCSKDLSRLFQSARRIVRGVAHVYGLSLEETVFTSMDMFNFVQQRSFCNADGFPPQEAPYSLWIRFSYPGMDESTRAELNKMVYQSLTTPTDSRSTRNLVLTPQLVI